MEKLLHSSEKRKATECIHINIYIVLHLFSHCLYLFQSGPDFSGGTSGHLPIQETQETPIKFLGWDDPLEKEIATHSSIPA